MLLPLPVCLQSRFRQCQHVLAPTGALPYCCWTEHTLTNAQNAGLRIITGGRKTTTPISEVERIAGLLSREERKEEKLLRQSEKVKRLPSHPLHSKFESPTKNRLKRQSPNHLVKAFQQKHRISSSTRNQPLEMLQDYEEWQEKLLPSSSTSKASKPRQQKMAEVESSLSSLTADPS